MIIPDLFLAQDPDADKLLASNSTALLIGMVLDQQIPLERAFSAPYLLQKRIGKKLTAKLIANMDPEELAAHFSEKPALHRFPSSMASRCQQVCSIVVDQYGGNPSKIWNNAETGDDLFNAISKLPGFGIQKAKIFAALLGKQFEVKPKGWKESCEPFGAAGSYLSIADIRDERSLRRVREYKQSLKAKKQ